MARRSRLLECRRVDLDRARDDEEHAIVPEGNAASSGARRRRRRGVGESADAVGAHALRDLEHLFLCLGGRVPITARPASRQKLPAGRLGGLEGGRERVDPELELIWIPPVVLGSGKFVMPCERMHAENFSAPE